jgi:hypothetical protein
MKQKHIKFLKSINANKDFIDTLYNIDKRKIENKKKKYKNKKYNFAIA